MKTALRSGLLALLVAQGAWAGNIISGGTGGVSQASLVTQAATTYYVDAAGSDSNSCVAAASPCLTIQAAINKIPKGIRHPTTVSIGVGNFAGFEVGNFNVLSAATAASGSFLNIVGTLSTATVATGTATGTATAGASGTSQTLTWGTLTDSGQSWTTNDLRGKVIETLTGTGSLQTAMICSNTSTVITICGAWTAPANGTTYAVRTWGTVLTSATTIPASLTLSSTTSSTSTVGSTVTTRSMWIHDNIDAFKNSTPTAISIQRIKGSSLGLEIAGPGAVALKLVTVTGTSGVTYGEKATVYAYQSAFTGSAFGFVNSGPGKESNLTVDGSLLGGGSSCITITTGSPFAVTNTSCYSASASGFLGGIQGAGNGSLTGVYVASALIGIGGAAPGSIPTVTASYTLSNVDISNCTTAIGGSGSTGNYKLTGVTGTTNTTGLFLQRGATANVDSTTTLTGTTEVSLDGTGSTLAAMRAASPKLVSNTYGTIFFE